MGSIWKEPHVHGRRRSDSGNRCSSKFVRGVGYVRIYGYRWVGQFTYHQKRYRKKSANFDIVYNWLLEMRAKYGDAD